MTSLATFLWKLKGRGGEGESFQSGLGRIRGLLLLLAMSLPFIFLTCALYGMQTIGHLMASLKCLLPYKGHAFMWA